MPDEVAEWLRRWTANPLGSPRVGSNPILVERNIFNDFEYSDGLSHSYYTLYHLLNKKIYVEMPGIEPGTFHMQSERSTAELHPPLAHP